MSQMNLSLSLRSRLLMGTAVVDAYAVEGFKPNLVFDFDDEYYRVNNTQTSFSDSITHSASSNATMVDESGVLKWRPHNLFLQSEDIGSASWLLGGNETIDADYAASPNGDITAVRIQMPATSGTAISQNFGATLVTGAAYTVAFFVKATSANTNFTLYASGSTTSISSAFTATSEWQLFEYDFTAPAPASGNLFVGINNGNDSFATDILVWGAHLYRSDLGGMVNNPDRGDSYVPTTSTARYLPRRGHHIYNGTVWVNEGMLHESEARTNLVTYSNTFTVASWNSSNITYAQNATGPDGSSNSAWTATISSTGNRLRTTGNSVTAETAYTFSFYAKKGTATGVNYAVYDVSNAAFIVNNTSYESDINESDWSRVYVTFTTPLGCTSVYVYLASGSGSTGTIFFYGAQLEAGSTPSSYIPNYGAPSGAHRAAETLTIPAAKLPWPTPNVIGPELTTGIWTGTGDTQDGTTFTGDNNEYWGSQFPTVIGKVYRLVGSIGNKTNNSQLRLRTGAVGSGSPVFATNNDASDASIDFVFVATTTLYNIEVLFRQDGASADLSGSSVREIDPLSVSIQMDGLETFADEGSATQETLFDWRVDANNRITLALDTDSTKVGTLTLTMVNGSGTDETISTTAELTPGVNDPFNVAIVCTSNEIGIALDGTAETRVSHSIGLPNLSGADATLGGNGTRALIRAWNQDITDAGIEAATA